MSDTTAATFGDATTTATVQESTALSQNNSHVATVDGDSDTELLNDPHFATFINHHKQLNQFFKDASPASELPAYDWDALSSVFEYIYKLYNDEINQILADFDKLDIKRSIWQESAFRLDAERASHKFKNLESWISNQNSYLNVQKSDLSSSVQIIKNTLNKLNNSTTNNNSTNSTDFANSTPI